MASKRKRSVMSLEKKLDIIAELRQGKSQRAVSNRFGVAKSMVGDIWKNKDKIIWQAFGIALQWLECQGTDPAHLMLVKNWMTTAGRKRDNSLNQTEITSYFKPHTS